jgi:FeS assembly SUF system protein
MESMDMPAPPPSPAAAALDDPQWAAAREGVAPGMENLEQGVIEVIKTCYDPEIPVNIYELGLIYKVGVDSTGRVWVDMTLTAPACPVAGTLPGEVEERIKLTPGVMDAKVNVVWDPPWDQSRMSEAAKLELGLI